MGQQAFERVVVDGNSHPSALGHLDELEFQLGGEIGADHPDPGEPLACLRGEDLAHEGLFLGFGLLLGPLELLLLLLLGLEL